MQAEAAFWAAMDDNRSSPRGTKQPPRLLTGGKGDCFTSFAMTEPYVTAMP